MNKAITRICEYYLNIILIMAGVTGLVYTSAGFDGVLITWALRLVSLAFLVRGITLPASVSMEVEEWGR